MMEFFTQLIIIYYGVGILIGGLIAITVIGYLMYSLITKGAESK